MNYKLSKEDVACYNDTKKEIFPKYTSQLINWANQNAQGTRPKVVGQLSEIFPNFLETEEDISLDNWKSWYSERYPNAIETATNKIINQIENLKEAIKLIDRDLVEAWVEDLVYSKTYNGMYYQQAILASLAEVKQTNYRLATPEEESVGIDGYVGDVAYSIKPDTYKTMVRLSETIDVNMIYYTKTSTGIKVEVDED